LRARSVGPLSAFFLHEFGWRGTCIAYAAIQVLFSLIVYLVARLPRADGTASNEDD